jgi:N utilization substance protein B
VSARSKARKRALDILFEADARGVDPVEVLQVTEQRRHEDGHASMNAYVAELVTGVNAHHLQIDDLLASYSTGWPLDRMPAVDRAILRLGAYEILWSTEVPEPVAISEAVALATDLSTDESPGFVNGLLARIAELKPRLGLDAVDPAAS